MRNLVSLGAGALFGLGLLVSGMTDTTKVQGWLDVFGAWDPTLAFVLGGAVGVMMLAWTLSRRLAGPLLGGMFPPRPDHRIDPQLALGSTLFGAGWGLAGLCPGPALASLSWGGGGGVLFLVAMGAGMIATVPIRRRFFA